MFRNYLKLTIRNLWKNKVFSGINIFGLSMGITVCILILLFVQYERSFDSFNTKNIYRLDEVQSFSGMVNPQKVALSMFPMGPTLKNEFPEIKSYARFFPYDDASLKYKDNKVFFKHIFWADSTFLKIFDYQLLKGNANNVLSEPNSVVLTRESAKRLFGDEEPMGKRVVTNNSMDTIYFTVTGIMENVPKNSHLQFDGLYSFNTVMKGDGSDQWGGGNGVVTYFEMQKDFDQKKLEAKFPAYLQKYMGKDASKEYKLYLQSLSEVHSDSADITHDYHNYKKFDKSYTNIFLVIAIIVLIIACVNFVNLSTARSMSRAKEVGVRKSIGAFRSQIALQFIGESIFLTLISTFIALLLSKLLLPLVSELSKHELDLSPISDPKLFFVILGGALIIGVISGVYPAIYLSSFQAVKVLKSNVVNEKGKSFTRNTLVTIQFACATFLIIGTIFGLKQLKYMQTKDPGFKSDQVVMLPGAYKNYHRLKTELLKNTLVKMVSGSTQRLGNNLHQTGVAFWGDGPQQNIETSHILVDHEFVKLYEIKIIAGKDFTEAGIGMEYMVNESMAKKLLNGKKVSYESLIGKKMSLYGDSAGTLVAVTKDFNFNSLHHGIETLTIYNKKPWGFHDVCAKIDGARTEEALLYLEATYKKIIPHFPFSFQFLDDHFASLYEADRKVSEVVGVLAGLAILIACLGLFGLASYSAEKRVKEVGIRKVLGASVKSIVKLLSFDFVKLVLLANIIAWPLAWYAVSNWLQNYAFRIEINLWVFLFSGLASILIAGITIASLTFRSATANPIKSLRTE
jgi:putative ABC transport system permease protein